MAVEKETGCTQCCAATGLAIRFVLGLLVAVYAVLILATVLCNFTALVTYETQALGIISAIVHGSAAVPLIAAIPAWVAIVVCILSVIFIAIWMFGGLHDAWWNNWLARWLALGNCGALPTFWQRAFCYWQAWNLIQELIAVGVFVSITGAIAAINIAALG